MCAGALGSHSSYKIGMPQACPLFSPVKFVCFILLIHSIYILPFLPSKVVNDVILQVLELCTSLGVLVASRRQILPLIYSFPAPA